MIAPARSGGPFPREAGSRGPRPADLGPLDPRVDLSIVIVNWNTKDLLADCLTSIRRYSGTINVETIVVDNGSRDGSSLMVTRDFPEIVLLANERNLGFAAANNRGLSRAHGRYLLLLNSDTLARPGAFAEMVGYMDAHPGVGALGPRLVGKDGTLQLSTRDFPRLDHDAVILLDVKHWPLIGDLARWYANREYGGDYVETHQVDWVQGSCLLLRREAVEQAGVLDDHYFFDYEESDLCFRLRQRGWPTVYLASAEIVHLGGQSRSRVSAVSLIWHYKSMLRYYRLHASSRRYQVVRWGVALGALAQVLWRLLRNRRAPADWSVLSAYARVAADAWAGAGRSRA